MNLLIIPERLIADIYTYTVITFEFTEVPEEVVC
jgi:hypothetical protein